MHHHVLAQQKKGVVFAVSVAWLLNTTSENRKTGDYSSRAAAAPPRDTSQASLVEGTAEDELGRGGVFAISGVSMSRSFVHCLFHPADDDRFPLPGMN